MDKLVGDMLSHDIIRPNKHTINDRFPIPLIEDLMDELGAVSLFSKLDLRSGFNQLRIEEGEEFKTSFKRHGGHFGYLVMLLGSSMILPPSNH